MNTKTYNNLIPEVKKRLTGLKQTGTSNEFVADCPFCGHKAKDGKFCFNNQKGLWKCHSGKCGKEGNASDLAEYFGIPINENGKNIKPDWTYQDENGNTISGIKKYIKDGEKQY
ncbi:MAG: CHC2 zinc finger domain-containing protein, partial [Patescibacteria group bacterium]